MSIRSIIEDSFGYVTAEDKKKLHAWEEETEKERQEAQKGTPATAINNGLGAVLSYGDKIIQGRIQAESIGQVQSRDATRVRTITEHVETKDVGNEFGW